VDENKLQFPLTLRKWQEGDYFYPFGMTGKKKLSKYFKDEKFSLIDKSTTWILCSDNEIVWVINKRMDDRFKVNNNTTTILKITIT
jgi:tRNA(Ile)-lysidine synthase